MTAVELCQFNLSTGEIKIGGKDGEPRSARADDDRLS